MRKTVLYIVFALFFVQATAQTQAIRDSIVGTYFCNVKFTANNVTVYNTDTIYPYVDPLDTIGFYIDDGRFCCWLVHMVLNNDSFFIATDAVSYGYFFAPDSFYYFLNCLSPLGCYYNFYCNKILPPIGIDESGFQKKDFSFSPNPANTKLFITSYTNMTNLNVQLKNVLGQIMHEKKYPYLDNSFELDVSKINNGIYFLNLIYGEKTKSFKVIIQH
jgi:hypothetical protein